MRRLFVHMPKCAGTSIAQMMPHSILDNDTFCRLPTQQRNERVIESLLAPHDLSEGAIVYGHFFPVKYIGGIMNSTYIVVTILRDPIERIKSHYNMWNNAKSFNHYVWRMMKEEQWTFEAFALCEEMRNLYTRYLSYVPIGMIAYIGLYENLEQSVRKCFEVLDIPHPDTPIPRANVTIDKADIELDADTYNRIKAFHADDYALYEYAKRKFHTEWSNAPQ